MKKAYKRLIVFAVAFAATLGILYYDEYHNFYDEGENGSDEVTVGERLPLSYATRGHLQPQCGLTLCPDLN